MIAQLRKHLPSQQALYNASPRLFQRMLVNLEAWRRDSFRRYGDYAAEMAFYDPAWYRTDLAAQEAYQVERLRCIVAEARRFVPHYRVTLPDVPIRSLEDLQLLPVLEKNEIRHNCLAFVREGVSPRSLWLHSTSGSTGTPLHFYHDRSVTRAHQAAADAFMAIHGCGVNERRVRISGVSVVPYDRSEPPFWIYIDRYHQLQCSAYHLGPATFPHYLRAIRESRARFGTGYASAWHLLGTYVVESGEAPPPLKAIFTDSEGVSLEQQALIERTFGCPVFQTYGTGEVSQIAVHCAHKRYHALSRVAIIEILDDANRPIGPGETGHIVLTDLTSTVTPFIRYRTGDLATSAEDPCACGWQSPSLSTIVGRLDDRVQTPEGRWVRVGGHIIRPAVGVRESQIVQTALDQLVVRVVPGPDFDARSMEDVLVAARRYLGQSMQVSWERVEALPRTRAGKLRHVVREF